MRSGCCVAVRLCGTGTGTGAGKHLDEERISTTVEQVKILLK